MKINKLFMGLAAIAFVGCSSDDLNVIAPEQAVEDARLVELDPNFVIAGVGAEASGTRTHWEQDAVSGALVNKFLPIFNANAAATKKLYNKTTEVSCAYLTAQAVGLCWLGQTPGPEVYTNYQFYHFGWLNKGVTKADYACGTLYNGALYSDITLAAATNGDGGEAIPGTDWVPAGLPLKATVNEAGIVDNLNYNSGVYKTENKSIFGGDYIVYYPFNEDFKEAGTIPAKAKTLFDWNIGLYKPVNAAPAAPNAWEAPELGDATFRYSGPVTIEGGDEAANFGLYNLSTLVRLRVACPAGDANINDVIDQIVLYSPSEKLLKQANLAADKIVAGQKGADLYAETEGTKTITTNFVTTATALNVKAATTVNAYITVLPTTVPDLVALVHNATDGTWATVDMGKTVFEAGKAKVLDIEVKAADFQSQYIAVDEASLTTALTEAHTAIGTDPTLKPTITVIGDIELKATTVDGTIVSAAGTYNINLAADANITITGDDIIVPENVTLNVNTNMDSKVRVLGTYCCSGAPNGGILNVAGGKISDLTMEPTEARVTPATYDALNPTVNYIGAATIAAGKTFDVQAGNVNVWVAVQHKGDIQIAEGAKLTVYPGGDLNFMGSKVTNDGTIEVEKNGKFDMTDANGNASATDGKNMTNNGTFIHNVDAGVGTAVQSMVQNGEYRCKVDDQIKLDDAFLQWTACSVIEFVNTSNVDYDLGTAKAIAYKHNDKFIDYEVNTPGWRTRFINPKPDGTNGDSEAIQIGNLSVINFSDFRIRFVEGTGERTLTVNGDMNVAANTILANSKKITITGDLNVDGAKLTYRGKKANEDGLAVTKDIKVSGGTFDAGSAAADVDALNITCANFTLADGAIAWFGNRTDGGAKNLVVSGTISNPAGCTFNIVAANQDGNGSVLAWVTCKKLEVGGTFSAARPRVVE